MILPDPQPKSQRCKEGERLFLSFQVVDEWQVSRSYFDHMRSCTTCKQARINEHKDRVLLAGKQ